MSDEIDFLLKKYQNFKIRVYTLNRLEPKIPVRRGKKSKPVMTPNGLFDTRFEAAEAFGVTDNTMYNWIVRTRKNEFYYIKEDDEENRTETE